MRIYLACTVRGDRGGVEAGRAICARLEAAGHDVLTRHLLEDDVERTESALSAEDVYRRDMQWLDGCDALVAEASGSSYGVGFEVGYMTGQGKRVVVLFNESRRDAISRLITGNCHDACTTRGYSSIDELMGLIDDLFPAGPA